MVDPQLLISAIERHKDRDFVWGKLDCALFVANVLQDATGTDYAEPLRGRYNSELGSYRILKPYGGLEGYLDSLFPRVHKTQAMRGDIVSLKAELSGRAVGICTGQRFAFMTADQGVIYVPMSLAEEVWQVS